MPTGRYRKKPLVVEAYQWFEGDAGPGVAYQTAEEAVTVIRGRGRGETRVQHTPVAYVVTIRGQWAYLDDGDWVITEPDGVHHYPCKPDYFAATYEPVEDGKSCPIIEALEAAREAGGDAWDAVPDVAAELGRDEPDTDDVLVVRTSRLIESTDRLFLAEGAAEDGRQVRVSYDGKVFEVYAFSPGDEDDVSPHLRSSEHPERDPRTIGGKTLADWSLGLVRWPD